VGLSGDVTESERGAAVVVVVEEFVAVALGEDGAPVLERGDRLCTWNFLLI
jgi:hypothetical protein